jgi:hypothetical protein
MIEASVRRRPNPAANAPKTPIMRPQRSDDRDPVPPRLPGMQPAHRTGDLALGEASRGGPVGHDRREMRLTVPARAVVRVSE